jgi:hypothetical protein
MRILLTGPTGFIGRHLLEALLADGHEVIAAARHPGAPRARLAWLPVDFARDISHATWLPRHPETFVEDPAVERIQAKLGWLLPMLRVSIALVWIATAIVSSGLYPVEGSYALLERSGIPAALAPLMLYGACALDLLFGVGTLFLPRRRWLWRAQLALIGFYTVVIAFTMPEFLLHPYGPLTKNIPMLAAIWLLAELEEH